MTFTPSPPPYPYDDPRLLYDEQLFNYDGGYDPHYIYDDPRNILYDEPCFFYDGGYDAVCQGLAPVATRRKHVGGRTASVPAVARVRYDDDVIDKRIFPYIDLTITSRPISVNHNKFEDLKDNVIKIKGMLETPQVEIIASGPGKSTKKEIVARLLSVNQSTPKISAIPKESGIKLGSFIIKAEPVKKK